jgi:hypothetical protein
MPQTNPPYRGVGVVSDRGSLIDSGKTHRSGNGNPSMRLETSPKKISPLSGGFVLEGIKNGNDKH